MLFKNYKWLVIILLLPVTSCREDASATIKKSLRQQLEKYAAEQKKELILLHIDSLTYSLSDSTVYFNHILNLLEQKSQHYSKMAKLRTDLAQSHSKDFLSGSHQENILQQKTTQDLDKSLEELKVNEREWNKVNDSMDLMLKAVHTTDNSVMSFYKVDYVLNTGHAGTAIMNSTDFRVVFIDF